MCGRYELKAKARVLNKHLPQLHLAQDEMPRTGEIYPLDSVLMITADHHGYLGQHAKWGLVGSFLDTAPLKPLTTLNSEGLASKPFYSKILKRSRCLIPATAFYEWQPGAGGKQKIRISHADSAPLMFAGIFDAHPLAGATCTILTTTANACMSAVHQRMPVILGPNECAFWLDEYAEFPDLEFEAMLQTASRQTLSLETIIEEAPSPQMSLAFT